jgi:hypothetical protein
VEIEGEVEQDVTHKDEDFIPENEITEISSYDPTETVLPLPLPYLRHLLVGETYILLFPGIEIPWWEFGSLEAEKQKLTYGEVKSSGEGRKKVIVPSEQTVEFTVFEREQKEEEFVPAQRLMRSNTVPSFRMSFHD